MVLRCIRAAAEIYEWYGGAYERLPDCTSGSATETSGCLYILVVRQRIRAVAKLYEWFGNRYERSQEHSSGSIV